jgi:hypothetical protein
VRHSRHYTLDEANGTIGWVEECLVRLREAKSNLGDKEARDALSQATPTNGGGEPGKVVSEAFLDLRNALVDLRERDIVLRDLDRGLVDFPSLTGDDEEIYLCWEEGEPEIGFWHDLETGFAGRRPLGDG